MRRRLESRRNEVWLVEDEEIYIQKRYTRPESKQRELLYLEIMKGMHVPVVERVEEEWVQLSYLEGSLLIDVYEELERQQASPLHMIRQLVNSLEEFYQKTQEYFGKPHRLGDMNFRNYIIRKNTCYRIDLEECTQGTIEEDIGRLMAFAMWYDPICTNWKEAFILTLKNECEERFQIQGEKIQGYYEDEVGRIKIRRGI
ncbi:MAG: hypothetical protein R3Y67_02250 [Eubacteriales bacterium]